MGRKKISKEEFLDRVRNPNYCFDNIDFVDMTTPIEVECLIHEKFTITPTNMLYKNEGCKQCGIESMKKTKALTRQEFINKAKKIHGEKFDYSLVDYKNNKTKILIICKSCGKIFSQEPCNHLKGCGCPTC